MSSKWIALAGTGVIVNILLAPAAEASVSLDAGSTVLVASSNLAPRPGYPVPYRPTLHAQKPPTTHAEKPVVAYLDYFQPGSQVVLTVSADGVDARSIGVTGVAGADLGKGSVSGGSRVVQVPVGADGSSEVSVLLTEAVRYTLTAAGTDRDGRAAVVSTTLDLAADIAPASSLPNSSTTSRNLLVAGIALLVAAAAAVILGRRRSGLPLSR